MNGRHRTFEPPMELDVLRHPPSEVSDRAGVGGGLSLCLVGTG